MNDQREAERVRLDSIQEQLLAALRAQGIEDRSILEIGCGTGHLHHRLLDEGATSVVGVELSADHLAKAKALTRELGREDRVRYFKGDFVKLADQIEPADVTILDKVVHCYHDPRRLIQQSTAHTRTLYALSFLRSRWMLRISMRLLSPVIRLFLPFRVRFSHPEKIRFWIQEAGFKRVSHTETDTWYTEIYVRREERTVGLLEVKRGKAERGVLR